MYMYMYMYIICILYVILYVSKCHFYDHVMIQFPDICYPRILNILGLSDHLDTFYKIYFLFRLEIYHT